jgi:hypothetical protein
MKKLIQQLVPLVFMIGMSSVMQSQTVITTAGSATSCPGEITIPVHVTGFAGVGAFSMVLNMNSLSLSYISYQNLNPELNAGTFIANFNNGNLYLAWFGYTAATIPNGSLLLELKFNGFAGTSPLIWDTQTPGNCEFTNTAIGMDKR